MANPGLNSGFMIPQYVAASVVSQNKMYSYAASTDSIVSSNGQEDHVSMGATSAIKLLPLMDNLDTILSIELMNGAQALDFRRPLRSSPLIERCEGLPQGGAFHRGGYRDVQGDPQDGLFSTGSR